MNEKQKGTINEPLNPDQDERRGRFRTEKGTAKTPIKVRWKPAQKFNTLNKHENAVIVDIFGAKLTLKQIKIQRPKVCF